MSNTEKDTREPTIEEITEAVLARYAKMQRECGTNFFPSGVALAQNIRRALNGEGRLPTLAELNDFVSGMNYHYFPPEGEHLPELG